MNKEIRELSGAICGHMDCGEWRKKYEFIIIQFLWG